MTQTLSLCTALLLPCFPLFLSFSVDPHVVTEPLAEACGDHGMPGEIPLPKQAARGKGGLSELPAPEHATSA
jgi:hypothetical protein